MSTKKTRNYTALDIAADIVTLDREASPGRSPFPSTYTAMSTNTIGDFAGIGRLDLT